MSATTSSLFQPIQVGKITLKHRLVLAPLTRYRCTRTLHVPIVPLVKEYYSQRSKTPGTLLITEATLIAAKAGGRANLPGIWNQEQIDAWKEVTDQVHANGSYIYLQVRGLGRTASLSVLTSEDPSFTLVAPSPIPITSSPTPVPQELTVDQIHEYVSLFAQAAKNAIDGAGFDGVEIHAANGYLVDQFIQDVSNQRTDEYGGSIEARSKFALDVIDAVAEVVGPEKTAIRLSPWGTYLDMRMADPIPQFTHLVTALRDKHPNLAYIHVIEPYINGNEDRVARAHESNDFLREIWRPRPFISAGGYTQESARQVAEQKGDLIAFGRMYISNPDLPLRVQRNIPFTAYNRDTFYVPGEQDGSEIGYIDYPFADSAAVEV